MPLSTSTRKKNVMNLIKNAWYSAGDRYLALSSTEPHADGTNVTEPEGTFETTGYKRISMSANIISGSNFPTEPTYDSTNDIYIISNQIDMYFYEAKSTWPTLGYFAIYDSLTNGNMLAYGSLESSISPTAGTIPVIRAGQLTISEEQIINS